MGRDAVRRHRRDSGKTMVRVRHGPIGTPIAGYAHGMHDEPLALDTLTPHAKRNRESWNQTADEYQQEHGEFLEVSGGLAWGVWQIPESELQVLGPVEGRDMLELGCGAAQWSIALAKDGARRRRFSARPRECRRGSLAGREL
jgi:hypothetical protein